MNRFQFSLGIILSSLFIITSCSKNDSSSVSGNQGRLELRLTDSPDPNVKEVWVDVQGVTINMSDTNEITLTGTHPGVYNLLDLTNGKDTLLADATIPTGTISQIRLLLGPNNYIVTNSGQKISLT